MIIALDKNPQGHGITSLISNDNIEDTFRGYLKKISQLNSEEFNAILLHIGEFDNDQEKKVIKLCDIIKTIDKTNSGIILYSNGYEYIQSKYASILNSKYNKQLVWGISADELVRRLLKVKDDDLSPLFTNYSIEYVKEILSILWLISITPEVSTLKEKLYEKAKVSYLKIITAGLPHILNPIDHTKLTTDKFMTYIKGEIDSKQFNIFLSGLKVNLLVWASNNV